MPFLKWEETTNQKEITLIDKSWVSLSGQVFAEHLYHSS
jgi:hypothetical protein